MLGQGNDAPLKGFRGNRVLTPDGLSPASFAIEKSTLRERRSTEGFLDAGDLLVLPGIVDVHGDAFERSLRPRPNVRIAHPIALRDVDAQLLAHGITTAFHGVTLSWEGGVRSVPVAQGMLDALRDSSAGLGADHRVHLRLETRFPEGIATAHDWIGRGEIHFLSLNDHFPQIAAQLENPPALAKLAERAECDVETFVCRVDAARRECAIPDELPTLVAHARRSGLSVASHDDPDAAHRRTLNAMGCNVAEFPLSESAARQARSLRDAIVFGAPNVLRGGSHVGAPGAEDMICAGLCDVLTSDYYYPAPLLAAFDLARRRILPLERAWGLVSRNAALCAGLSDRGSLASGHRADFLLLDDDAAAAPRVVAAVVGGRLRYASRIV